MLKRFGFILPFLVFVMYCSKSTAQLFNTILPQKSKVDFVNQIIENDTFNYFFYDNIYNGAGVAVGDINNDGLPDIYFVSNQGDDQLYLNLGKLKFKNITKTALGNQNNSGWNTAVSFADINNDGWLDIYVCRHGLGQHNKVAYRNLAFINNKNKTFTERAAEFGIDDPGRSMDADFFDFDQDGDLDLFVSNHRENPSIMDQFNKIAYLEQFHSNRLYRNDNGRYTDVTKLSGVLSFGYCLSTSIADINNDGWPDIYVTSDFNLPDFLFINQQNGEFKNEAKERLRHTSHYSMGIDIADFNNDGFQDVCVLDMSNRDYVKSKTNMASMSMASFWDNVAKGFNYQYMYNTLQLNHGNGYFSEIAHMAGIASTDWSWAPLFVDFDQDGYKDIFATNGYFKDVRDKDFTVLLKNYMSSHPEKFDVQKMLALIPQSKEINYVFKNNSDLTFANSSAEWGLTTATNSNGAAYADLDNDGDVDVVINNLNEPATILENTINNKNYIKIKLKGSEKNHFAYGAKITAYTNKGNFVAELNPSRGYASSSDLPLIVGLGKADTIFNLSVQWNSKEMSNYTDIEFNQTFLADYTSSKKEIAPATYFLKQENKVFTKVKENEFDDFKREVLLPHKMSQLGPFLASGLIDGETDTEQDLFIGGAKGERTKIYRQVKGEFILTEQPGLAADSMYEDAGATFFDFDQDGFQDLYIVSGGNEADQKSKFYQHRLYLNNRKGVFLQTNNILPEIKISGQGVYQNDVDSDGDIDLFVPGRQVPGLYSEKPKSIWLKNENGKFIDAIDFLAPELKNFGMITDAVFTDFDKDGDDDLIVVGEWMSPSFFENKNGIYTQVDAVENSVALFGWWNCIEPLEEDKNGNMIYLLGNLGLNNKFHPSAEYPLMVQLSDFDKNGKQDLVLSKYFAGVKHPVRGRECLSEQIPSIAQRFSTYNDFANSPYEVIFGNENKFEKVTTFASGILVKVNSVYQFIPFDNLGQIGCINAFIVLDANGDDKKDFIAFGNKYEAEIETPRYDANPGLMFMSRTNNKFDIYMLESFAPYVNKNAKDALLIGTSIFVANSDESIDRIKL